MCVITYAELEIAVGNWPFSDQFLPFGRTNSIFLATLYIPMGKPLLVYNNVSAFKEWPTNFKSIFQAPLMLYVVKFWWSTIKILENKPVGG